MYKKILFFVWILVLSGAIFVCQASANEDYKAAYSFCSSGQMRFQSEFVYEISVSVTIYPIKDSEYCYDFDTEDKNEIAYIVHLLNSMNLIDDGKVIRGADLPVVNINITTTDGYTQRVGFVAGRFYDDSGKQYDIDYTEYNRFLNFIYALKTKEIILDDEVTFEASEWAKNDIDTAVKKELVPSFNQINYTGKISRLEVCQLIDNLLANYDIEDAETKDNPFTDTKDKTIINLYNYHIVNGKTENEFFPYDYITREEFAEILSNVYGLLNGEEETAEETTCYVDREEISDWAKDSVDFLGSKGILIGDTNNKFRPKEFITKQEVIISILRLANMTV